MSKIYISFLDCVSELEFQAVDLSNSYLGLMINSLFLLTMFPVIYPGIDFPS